MFTDRKVCSRLFKTLVPVTLLLFTAGCERHPAGVRRETAQAPFIRYKVESYRQTREILDRLGYSEEAFQKGMKEIPPVLLTKISARWNEEAKKIPVAEKKSLFLRLLAAGALMADAEVLQERKHLLELLRKMEEGEISPKESRWLRRLALKYRILKSPDGILTPAGLKELRRRVDIVPPSLIVAQGAIESAWGTSRFAVEGNALFGQWHYGGDAMKPKKQRKELGDYGLARFKTPLDSIRAYLLNLNTYPAYRPFRDLRAKLRAEGKPLDGKLLAGTLTRYSERGEAYVEDLRRLIRANRLGWLDRAKLKKMKPVYIHPDR
ncbi:glucosaminidase domain-containing protein [Hydrogenimonas sp. SS33]|uniref:glucosaminidase domain-containing protein n=1 Tax=Hydrogenimonas leucolamina TaxID=2954236 RepID=UPI00336BDBAF